MEPLGRVLDSFDSLLLVDVLGGVDGAAVAAAPAPLLRGGDEIRECQHPQ